MARRITQKDKKRQSVGAGIMLAVLIGFASFLLYQSIAQESEKTKIIVVNGEGKRSGGEKDETGTVNTNEQKREDSSINENVNTASETEKEEDLEVEDEKEEKPSIGGPGEVKGERFSDEFVSVLIPDGWSAAKNASGSIGLVPADSEISDLYEGDIVVNPKENAENLSIKNFYDGEQNADLFRDALGGFEPIEVNGYEGFLFKEVEGYVPANVAVIKKGDVMIEITDAGMGNAENGIFDAVVNSIK